jgi:hypothetical protein
MRLTAIKAVSEPEKYAEQHRSTTSKIICGTMVRPSIANLHEEKRLNNYVIICDLQKVVKVKGQYVPDTAQYHLDKPPGVLNNGLGISVSPVYKQGMFF